VFCSTTLGGEPTEPEVVGDDPVVGVPAWDVPPGEARVDLPVQPRPVLRSKCSVAVRAHLLRRWHRLRHADRAMSSLAVQRRDIVPCMPVPAGTRQRYNPNPAGGRTPGVPRRIGVTVRLEMPEHEKLHAAAAALGTTLSVVMSELVRRLELDEHNKPAWLESPPAAPHQEQLIA